MTWRALIRPSLWTLGLAGVAAAVGLQTVPYGRVAARAPYGAEAADLTYPAGVFPALRLWHTWTVAHATPALTFGLGGRAPWTGPSQDGHPVKISATVALTLTAPVPDLDATLRAAATTALSQRPAATLPTAQGRAQATQAITQALTAHPGVTDAQVHLVDVRLTGDAAAQADAAATRGLVTRLSAARAAHTAAQLRAQQAADRAARATERAQAQAAQAAADARAEVDARLATLQNETAEYVLRTQAAGDALSGQHIAEGELTHARALAEVDALTAQALATQGGRWLLALQAARAYRVPANLSLDAAALSQHTSVAAWKRYFTQGLSPATAPSARPARAEPRVRRSAPPALTPPPEAPTDTP